MIDSIGYLASIIGTFMMLPQVVRGHKTKDMKSISWGMIVMYILNCILWNIYGFGIHSYPLILSNSIALFIGIYQLYLKLKFK